MARSSPIALSVRLLLLVWIQVTACSSGVGISRGNLLGCGGQVIQYRAIRPMVSVTGIGQFLQLIADGLQFANVFLQLSNILARQIFHIGAFAIPVFP